MNILAYKHPRGVRFNNKLDILFSIVICSFLPFPLNIPFLVDRQIRKKPHNIATKKINKAKTIVKKE